MCGWGRKGEMFLNDNDVIIFSVVFSHLLSFNEEKARERNIYTEKLNQYSF